MENTKTTSTNEKEKEVKIKNNNPIPFKNSASTEYITTTELCEMINSVFAGLFADYYGCKLIPNQYGVLELSFIFKHIDGSDDLQATYKISENIAENDNRILKAINSLQSTSFNRKIYDLTDVAKKALAPYMIPENFVSTSANDIVAVTTKGNRKTNGINWGGRLSYINQDNTQYIEVKYVSVEAIVGFIHGEEIDNHKMQYNVMLVKPIGFVNGMPYNNMVVPNQKYLLAIAQADANEIAEVLSKVNCYIPTMNNNSFTNVVRA